MLCLIKEQRLYSSVFLLNEILNNLQLARRVNYHMVIQQLVERNGFMIQKRSLRAIFK